MDYNLSNSNSSHTFPRVSFKGDYHKYECTIQVEKITTEDEGTWKCEVESYVFGPFRGTVKTKTISMNVFQSQSKSQPKSKLFKKLEKDLKKSIKWKFEFIMLQSYQVKPLGINSTLYYCIMIISNQFQLSNDYLIGISNDNLGIQSLNVLP